MRFEELLKLAVKEYGVSKTEAEKMTIKGLIDEIESLARESVRQTARDVITLAVAYCGVVAKEGIHTTATDIATRSLLDMGGEELIAAIEQISLDGEALRKRIDCGDDGDESTACEIMRAVAYEERDAVRSEMVAILNTAAEIEAAITLLMRFASLTIREDYEQQIKSARARNVPHRTRMSIAKLMLVQEGIENDLLSMITTWEMAQPFLDGIEAELPVELVRSMQGARTSASLRVLSIVSGGAQ